MRNKMQCPVRVHLRRLKLINQPKREPEQQLPEVRVSDKCSTRSPRSRAFVEYPMESRLVEPGSTHLQGNPWDRENVPSSPGYVLHNPVTTKVYFFALARVPASDRPSRAKKAGRSGRHVPVYSSVDGRDKMPEGNAELCGRRDLDGSFQRISCDLLLLHKGGPVLSPILPYI